MTVTEMLRIQFYDSYNMLKEIVKICPNDLWSSENHGLPVWNQVIHTIMGSTFWLRVDYSSEFCRELPLPEKLGEKIINDDWVESTEGFLTKEEMQKCFDYLDKNLEAFWDSINDDMLCKNIREAHSFTYLSVISAQIRHIMCHVGMCNAALIENGFDEVEWIAYGEN